ncbi:MAG: pitrilysin family protein, partial [Phycisphaerae bacterium]
QCIETLPVVASPATTAPATRPGDLKNVQVIQRITEEPGRRVVRLANGLTVILQENHTAPVVAARDYIKAGSLTEQEYMGAGISHVLEHLVAGGSSASLKESDSQQALRILGGDSNAYTSLDQTCYFITTTAEKWPLALELLSDWTTRADFTEAEFRREYQVVQREIEMGESEAGRTFSKLTYTNRYLVFPARHPVIGYKPAFQKLTWQDCRTYFKRMYIPDNMIVSIAGDIDLDGALKLVQQNFAHTTRQVVPSISLPVEPAVTSPRLAVAHADVKRSRAQWAFPTVDMYDPDMYPLDVLANILAAGDSSILVRTLRDQQQLVTAVYASNDTPRWAAGQLEIMAELEPRDIAKTQRVILEIIESIKNDGVTAEQVQKARAQVAAGLVYSSQTAEQQASRNASDFLATGSVKSSQAYVERIAQVTPEQVRAAARKYLKPEVLLTTLLLPKGTPDELAGLTSTTQAAAVRPTVELVTLPNGLKVLIGRNPAAPIVSIQYYTLGALLAENDANNGIGNAL